MTDSIEWVDFFLTHTFIEGTAIQIVFFSFLCYIKRKPLILKLHTHSFQMFHFYGKTICEAAYYILYMKEILIVYRI